MSGFRPIIYLSPAADVTPRSRSRTCSRSRPKTFPATRPCSKPVGSITVNRPASNSCRIPSSGSIQSSSAVIVAARVDMLTAYRRAPPPPGRAAARVNPSGCTIAKAGGFAGLFQWARLGSNQRPLACEASALPLSYAPGRGDSTRRRELKRGGPRRLSVARTAAVRRRRPERFPQGWWQSGRRSKTSGPGARARARGSGRCEVRALQAAPPRPCSSPREAEGPGLGLPCLCFSGLTAR